MRVRCEVDRVFESKTEGQYRRLTRTAVGGTDDRRIHINSANVRLETAPTNETLNWQLTITCL